MNYIFVWKKTGERRMPRFGEWYVTETLGCTGPFQYNGRTVFGKYEIVVRCPVDSKKGYTENVVVDKNIAL